MEPNMESVSLAGLSLEHPVMNAAGTCKRTEDVERLSRSAAAAIVIGSMTVLPREGNSGQVYQQASGGRFSLNSLGLPNGGKDYYMKALPETVKIAHDAGKPLLASAAGFSPSEYAELATLALDAGADLVELNLGCPNVWQGSDQKPIASFNPDLVGEILGEVQEAIGTEKPVSVKLSPYSDPELLTTIAGRIANSPLVKVVTTTNTFPNAFGFDQQGRPLIRVTGQADEALAGLGGPAMKAIGLGQVMQFRKLLPERIQIIGVGGISTGSDIQEYLQVGAIAVQVATAYLRDGQHDENVFSRLLMQWQGIE